MLLAWQTSLLGFPPDSATHLRGALSPRFLTSKVGCDGLAAL